MIFYKVKNNRVIKAKNQKEPKPFIVIKEVEKPENIWKTKNKFYLIYFIHNLETWVIEKGEKNEII